MAAVRAWRAISAEHETEYLDLVRLATLSTWLPAFIAGDQPPAAPAVIARRATGHPERGRGDSARPRGGRALRWSMAAAAVLVLGVATTLLLQLADGDGARGFGAEAFVTGPVETATVILSDGSVVKLAPRTRLHLEPARSERRVALDGQAFFSVAPDKTQPFVVRTAEGEIRVLGTRFDLSARGDDLQLTVVEGRVSVSGGLEGELRAGQVGRVVAGTPLPVLEVDDPHEIIEWTGQFIAFQSTPLAEAVRELMRHYAVQIVITDSTIARRTITAWFSDWSLDDVMTVVCAVAEARCSTEGNLITIEPGRRGDANQ
jgi:transmembrane sensor